jgi:hypothetical protein
MGDGSCASTTNASARNASIRIRILSSIQSRIEFSGQLRNVGHSSSRNSKVRRARAR